MWEYVYLSHPATAWAVYGNTATGLLGGIVAEWGLDKAVVFLCVATIARLLLAEAG